MPRWNEGWYEARIEAAFKSVEGGYVVRAPNPWVFARPRYYLVNEAQKIEIAARLGRWLQLLTTLKILFSFILVMTLAPATFERLILPRFHQLGASVFTLLMIFLIALLVASFVVIRQIFLARPLRPLLADAPHTEERIKFRERLATIAAFVSTEALVLELGVGLGLVGTSVLLLFAAFPQGHLARTIPLSSVLLVAGGLMAAFSGYLIGLKAKLKREAALRHG